MTNLHERMLPDPRIEPATVYMPGGCASDRAIRPGESFRCFRRRCQVNQTNDVTAKSGTLSSTQRCVLVVFWSEICRGKIMFWPKQDGIQDYESMKMSIVYDSMETETYQCELNLPPEKFLSFYIWNFKIVSRNHQFLFWKHNWHEKG